MAEIMLERRVRDIEEVLDRSIEWDNERFARMDKGLEELRKEMGRMSMRLGTIVEDFVAPDLPRILRSVVPCPEDEEVLVNTRVRRRHPTQRGQVVEIDAIADCGEYVLFNETKNRLRPEYVQDFLDKLAVARDYFPEYRPYQIIGCVASLYVDASLVQYAARQGLLVLALGEGLMVIQNEPDFKWRAF